MSHDISQDSETYSQGSSDSVLPLLAIVGRPNVGKSTLFNRIVGRRKAIVQNLPGTTRDRNYDEAEWCGHRFRIVDTGGLRGEQDSGEYSGSVTDQVSSAMSEAEVICFVVDAQSGLISADEEIASELRKSLQPVHLVVNKVDNDSLSNSISEFYRLGLGDPIAISAHHGRGVGDFLDDVVRQFSEVDLSVQDTACRLAIIGRPNVGKSSLINAILREPRMIVSSIPGTTRDAIDTGLDFENHRIVLVDTAGIRRRGKVQDGVERASVSRAKAAVSRADVAAIVIDGSEDITAQDQHVLSLALDAAVGIIFVINKTDLLRGETVVRDRRERQMRWRSRFIPWAPVIWVSALNGERIDSLLRSAVTVAEERRRRIPTSRLNPAIRRATIDHSPPSFRGRPVRFLYATQAGIEPPTFVFFVNQPEGIHFSYERYLQGRIRNEFGYDGVPLKFRFKARKAIHD